MQLAGSIHLVAPNPYYRAFQERLVEARPPEIESVTVAIEPRNHVALPSLEVELIEHRPTGLSCVATVVLDAQPRAVALGPALYLTSATVKLATGGVLESRAPASFHRELQVNMDLVHGTRIVNVVNPLGQRLETYDVAVTHPNMTTRMGASTSTGAESALTALMNEVSVRDSARQLEQHWFAQDPDAARNFVRSLIRSAREQVLIADPYLGGVEIQRYALAVQLAGVRVRLLTTREGFKGSLSPPVLETSIARWQATEPSLGQIETKVMKRDELHDRFLRIDGRLYTLGNSLNTLGDKGSLMMRIPDPSPVFDKLERIWQSSDLLADIAASWRAQ